MQAHGFSPATLTLTAPSSRFADVIVGTRCRMPTLPDLAKLARAPNRANLGTILPMIHEMEHFADLCSTDMGTFLALIDHLRVNRMFFLIERIGDKGIGSPVALPLVWGVLEKAELERSLLNLAWSHQQVRRWLMAVRRVVFRDATDVDPDIERVLAHCYREGLHNPFVGQCFHEFVFSERDLKALRSKTHALPANLLLEISAHLTVVSVLLMRGADIDRARTVAGDFAPLSRDLNDFVFNMIGDGHHPFFLKYVVWRCMHGRLVRLPSDPTGPLRATDEHPALRFAHATEALLQGAFSWPDPSALPSASDVGPLAHTRAIVDSLEKQVTAVLGFAPLSEVVGRWSSAAGYDRLWYDCPPGFENDWHVLMEHSERFLLEIIRRTAHHLERHEVLFLAPIFGARPDNVGDAVDHALGSPSAMLLADELLLAGKDVDSERDVRALYEILWTQLLLDLDSQKPTEMRLWLDPIGKCLGTAGDELLSKLLAAKNLSVDDIDWERRITRSDLALSNWPRG